MNNDPNQSQWGQEQSQSQGQGQWGQQQQYAQPQWSQQSAEQYSQYNQPQWGQLPTQYTPPQYGANQYGVPSYAQAQPQGRQSDNLLMGWLAARLLIRVVVLVAVLMLCGGCALFVLLSTLAHP